jgi:hypothetical protein
MRNKVFNNERPASVKADMGFYGKMRSDASIPAPKFTEGESKNYSIDYGNQVAVIRSSQVNIKDKKSGLNFR